MGKRVGVVAVIVAAVLAASALVAVAAGGAGLTGTQDGSSSASRPLTDGDQAQDQGSDRGGSSTRSGGDQAAGGGSAKNRTNVPLSKRRNGSEQPTQAPDSDLSKGLPGVKATHRLTVAAPRSSGSAQGRLVAGFPRLAASLPAGSRVRFSSVSHQGSRVRADLVAATSSSPVDVFGSFRRRLAGQGLAEGVVPAMAGSQARSYSDGRSAVTVTVKGPAGSRSVTVAAVLQAG